MVNDNPDRKSEPPWKPQRKAEKGESQRKQGVDMVHKILGEISLNSGVKMDDVRYALELSLEGALCEYFNIQECDIDLDGRSFVPISDMPLAGKPLKKDTSSSRFTFNMLPKEIVLRCRDLFLTIMQGVEGDELFKKWKSQVHKAVEGRVVSDETSRVLVDLGDQARGIMEKAEWVPLEMKSYREGKLFRFYVLRVTRKASTVEVYLSRGSLNLPAALLRLKMPWADVRGLKRIRGKKCWITCDCPVEKATVMEISRELQGEAIKITR